VRCGLEFDFLDVVVAADGTPYASLVDGCTAEECHSRLVSVRIYVHGRRVRTGRGRGLRAPIELVRLARGRVRVMIVARTSTGRTVVHTRRYRTCAR
jgi:hypothetical protein